MTLAPGFRIPQSGYRIARSLRFRSGASAKLSRTVGSTALGPTAWTWACWVKRGSLGGANNMLINSIPSVGNNYTYLTFNGNDKLAFYHVLAAATSSGIETAAVYRDTAAWMHVMLVYDSSNATATDRLRIYVNGTRQATSVYTAPASGAQCYIGGNTAPLEYGRYDTVYSNFNLAECHFLHGTAETSAAAFIQTSVATGVIEPRRYIGGAYGANGHCLKFSDNSAATAAAIGADSSGNGLNFTPTGISVTAGVTDDSLVDTPTNYGADTGLGGEARGNYATLNPIMKNANATYGVMATPNSGNLEATLGAGGNVYSSMALSDDTGKYYAEVRCSSVTGSIQVGIMSGDGNVNRSAQFNSTNGVYSDNTSKGTAGFTIGNTVGIAVDTNAGTVQFYSNNVAVGSAYTYTKSYAFPPHFHSISATAGYVEWNFGQRAFLYTAPTGFKALCTQNLPVPTIKKSSSYFDVNTRTGTGAVVNITGKGFQPDFVWIKNRGATGSHELYDSVRTATKYLLSDSTGVEGTVVNGLTSFNSDGFSLGSSAGANSNQSANTYVDWFWKKGATPGFDIVTYTGTGANRTIAHALGVTPAMVFIKNRTPTANHWGVYHKNQNASPASGYTLLSATVAFTADATFFNSTAPTSSVFSVGTATTVNTNTESYLAYLFVEVPGFSKFGSYTGNGSVDGPFIHCGFRPRWIMFKEVSGTNAATSSWQILDTARDTYNTASAILQPNASSAESSAAALDILSNGFKLRTANQNWNESGGTATYIYAAFAEAPSKYARAR